MFNALYERVKSLLGLETEGRKRRLAVEPNESPERKVRRIEKPFGLTNYAKNMDPQLPSGIIRSDSKMRRSVLEERPDVELCWEKRKHGKENQFHWGMLSKEYEENDVVELDDDVKTWRELKPVRRGSSFMESKPSSVQVRRKANSLSRGEVHLDDDEDEEVTILKESSRQDVEEIFPSRLHSSLDPGRSNCYASSAAPDISPITNVTKSNPPQRMRTFFTNNTSLGNARPSFGLVKYNLTPLTSVNPKRETKSVSRLDSASVKNRIRTGNLSRAAILKQSLPPPPHYFGTEPKIAPKWAGLSSKAVKKTSALDVSSSIDERKAYNQMLQHFTSEKNSVSKMLSSGMECPAFKIFESQLRRNFNYNKLLKARVNGIEASHKIDMIDLSKSDDEVQEVEFLGGDAQASGLQRKQMISISKDAHEATGASQKAVKIDVQRTREVTPKTSGEAAQNVTSLARPTHNLVDQLIKKSQFTDEEYIEDIIQRYSIEKSKINKEVERETMKRELWSERRHKFEESIEAKLIKYMKITDVSYDEILIEEEEKLPELTTEMLDVVHNALRKNRSCVLARSGSNTITGADIQTLADSNWLNDEVINNYMDMLIQRGQSKEYPSVYAFNTFFYPRLSSSGYASVKRWTKKVDLFQQDMVLVPLHLEVHWALAVIDFRQKTICYYDSMNGRKINILQLMLKYLQEERMDKKKESYNTSGWHTKLVQDIPQQRNGYDCGVFACMFAEHLARGVVKDDSKKANGLKYNRSYPPFPFSQENMPYFRKRMIYEILTGKLLQ